MNKQCKACGSLVPSDARFCQTCGGSDFVSGNMPTNEDAFENTTLLNEDVFENTTVLNEDAFENTTVLSDEFESTTLLNENFEQPSTPQPPVNQTWQQPTVQNWQQPPAEQTWQQPAQNWQQPPVQNWQQPAQNWQQPPAPNMQQNWQQPASNMPPVNQPKKSNTGLIVGIIAGVVVILAIIGFVAEKAFQSMGYGDSPDVSYDSDYDYIFEDDDYYFSDESEETSSVEEKVEYTKGYFNGTYYQNDWADIKLYIPNDFSDADAATYAASENESTDCGAYFVANDTLSAIYICYEKLPSFPVYDEEDYLDAVMDTLGSVTEVSYNTTSIYTTSTIGGYAYAKASCSFTNDYGMFYHNIYVRKIDNYVVVVSAMGTSDSIAEALAQTIIRAN